MRIISGEFKGRIIKTADIFGTRPTYDKVREALFNILGGTVKDTKILDLYAGFGSLGIEALSRGAQKTVFVEKNRRCAQIIKENLETFKLTGKTDVLVLDVFRGVEKLARMGESFDIIFVDAPYHNAKISDPVSFSPNQNLLQIVDSLDILKKNGLLIIEHFKRDKLDFFGKKLSFQTERQYGDTLLSIYKNDKGDI